MNWAYLALFFCISLKYAEQILSRGLMLRSIRSELDEGCYSWSFLAGGDTCDWLHV